MSNLVIVAIPDENDRVWKVSSEQVPHLTLLFLGDTNEVANLDKIMSAVVTIVGGLGASQITCTDPESEGDDTDDVIAVGTVSVVPGKAVVGDVQLEPSA